ncbi:MAG: hypothetical protein RL701_7539, partial [Pseudomonadota bacterium]
MLTRSQKAGRQAHVTWSLIAGLACGACGGSSKPSGSSQQGSPNESTGAGGSGKDGGTQYAEKPSGSGGDDGDEAAGRVASGNGQAGEGSEGAAGAGSDDSDAGPAQEAAGSGGMSEPAPGGSSGSGEAGASGAGGMSEAGASGGGETSAAGAGGAAGAAAGSGGTAPTEPACDATTEPKIPALKVQTLIASSQLDVLTFATQPPNSDDWYLVSQRGKVSILRAGALLPTPFLDLSSEINLGAGFDQTSVGYDERGLSSLTFAPDYETSGLFYIAITPSAPDNPILGGGGLQADHDQVLE